MKSSHSLFSRLKNSIISGITFFVTVWILSIGYSNYVSNYPASVGTGSGLSANEWNKMISALQTLDLNLSNLSFLAGKVGIGTTNPGQTLSVSGTIESTNGGIKFPDGTTQTSTSRGATRIARFSGSSLGGTGGVRQLELNVTEYNTSGYTLAGNTVTIQNAGYYRIFSAFGFDVVDNATSNYNWFYLYKNGVLLRNLDFWYGVGYSGGLYYTDAMSLKGQYTGYFNIGDTVSLYTNCVTAGSVSAWTIPITLEIQAL